MWDILMIGFVFAIGMALFSLAWYVIIMVIVLVTNVIGWVIEKAKGN
jgi:hypothetical protein